jgi:hypothetical protein
MPLLVFFTYVVYLLFTLGLLTRFISPISTILTWYFFLLEKGNYNNHYYLHCLLATLFIFVDARNLGLDKLIFRNVPDRLPRWHLLIFQLQIAVVYFFGGIAKLDVDWLQGYPIRYWLYDYAVDELASGSLLQQFFMSSYVGITYAILGLLFDLLVPLALLTKRLRFVALPFVVLFHLSNHFVFNIGSFPWMMLAATVIYFDYELYMVRLSFAKWFGKRARQERSLPKERPYIPKRSMFATIFVVIWMVIQITVPLRHFLYRGDVAWNGQGNWFAWRMMLTDMVDGVSIKIMVPKDNESFYVKLDDYMNYYQFNKAVRCPMIILKLIDHLQEQLDQHGVLDDAIIKLEMYKGVNFRPPQLFNDTTLNYAKVKYDPLSSQDWILPFERKWGEVTFNEDYYHHWEHFLQIRERLENKDMDYQEY